MKTLYISVLVMLAVLTGAFYYLKINQRPEQVSKVLSFEDCVKAGYIVMESYPRQCRTPDGLTFAEEIVQKISYVNSSSDLIQVDLPFPGAVTGKDFRIVGKARGVWYFEASFPVQVLDKNGAVLFEGPAQAEGDWMTNDFVPFEVQIKVPDSYIGPATIILKKDNPSGEAQRDASISFPITIEY
jgi:hypothetical protein